MTSLLNKINTLFLKHQVTDIEGLIEIKNQLSSQQKNSQDLEKNIIGIDLRGANAVYIKREAKDE